MDHVFVRTERLLLRHLRPADAASIAAYRSDPSVAEHQAWTVPYPLERAEELVRDNTAIGGPTDGEWWSVGIVTPTSPDVLIGDVAIHLSAGGRTVEIGYTLAPEARGRGYATEAARAALDHLFTTLPTHRAEASLHPANVASARVLERLGFTFEGISRRSYWLGDECTDDAHYSLLREEWEAGRVPVRRPDDVRLVEITHETVRATLRLSTHRTQESLVAPVSASLAQALHPPLSDGPPAIPLVPWYRAVEADGELVGFVMLSETSEAEPEPFLWRLLVDRRHQRRGIGDRIIALVVDQVRAWGASSLLVSWVPGPGSPAPFYLARGFVPTGEMDDDEIVARLTID